MSLIYLLFNNNVWLDRSHGSGRYGTNMMLRQKGKQWKMFREIKNKHYEVNCFPSGFQQGAISHAFESPHIASFALCSINQPGSWSLNWTHRVPAYRLVRGMWKEYVESESNQPQQQYRERLAPEAEVILMSLQQHHSLFKGLIAESMSTFKSFIHEFREPAGRDGKKKLAFPHAWITKVRWWIMRPCVWFCNLCTWINQLR